MRFCINKQFYSGDWMLYYLVKWINRRDHYGNSLHNDFQSSNSSLIFDFGI